jgi:hypothetical protein
MNYTTWKLAAYLEELLGGEIITSTVAFQTHNSCWSSWIIDQGKMKGIHLFYITFLESLPMIYTTLKLVTDLEEILGNTK